MPNNQPHTEIIGEQCKCQTCSTLDAISDTICWYPFKDCITPARADSDYCAKHTREMIRRES
jgi:hypothetical protein